MIRDKRIRRVGKGKFRVKLGLQDVTEPDSVFDVTTEFGGTEKVGIFIEQPIKIPYSGVLFAGKVKELDDVILSDIVGVLSYFNEGIDWLGTKKMVEFIGRYCVVRVDGEPKFRYEELYPVVKALIPMCQVRGVDLVMDVVAVYDNGTQLGKEQRRDITYQTRSLRNSKLKGEIIHNAAMTVIEKSSRLLAVSKGMVLSETKKNGVKSINTLNKEIKDVTVDMLQLSAKNPLKSLKDIKNYKEFCMLGNRTYDFVTTELGVSRSTVKRYSDIYKEFGSITE